MICANHKACRESLHDYMLASCAPVNTNTLTVLSSSSSSSEELCASPPRTSETPITCASGNAGVASDGILIACSGPTVSSGESRLYLAMGDSGVTSKLRMRVGEAGGVGLEKDLPGQWTTSWRQNAQVRSDLIQPAMHSL